MGVQTTFETDPQLAEARQPRMRSLHHPAMPSQSLAAFHSPPGDSCGNAALTQMPATSLEVVPLVGVQLVRSAAWTPLQASNRRQCIDQWLEHHRIMSVPPGGWQRLPHRYLPGSSRSGRTAADAPATYGAVAPRRRTVATPAGDASSSCHSHSRALAAGPPRQSRCTARTGCR